VEAVCPVCGRNDQIQKVSGVVSSGTATYSGSTVLSDRLRMLSEPSADTTAGCIAGWLTAIGVFCCVAVPFDLLSMVMGRPFSQSDAALALVAEIILAFPAFGIAWILFSAQSKQNRAAETKHQQWAAARAKWDTLYYCFRDDVVFLPNGAGWAPSTNWASLVR
jgi:hypothetical protein